jgi:hypothetical protein
MLGGTSAVNQTPIEAAIGGTSAHTNGELRAMTQDTLLLTVIIAWTSVVCGVLAYMALTL